MSEQNDDIRGQMKRNFNTLARALPVMFGQMLEADTLNALSASAKSIAAWDLQTGGTGALVGEYEHMQQELLRGFKAVSREANVLGGQGNLTAQDALAAASAMDAIRTLDETAQKLANKGQSREKDDNVVDFGDGRRLQAGVPSLGQR